MGWKCLNSRSKKKGSARNTTPETLLSLSTEDKKRIPCKMTQIFIGAPELGHGCYDEMRDSNITQEQWPLKYCKDKMRMHQEVSTESEDEEGKGHKQNNDSMTQEEWCAKYCEDGRARRGSGQALLGHGLQLRRPLCSQRVPQCLPCQQPQMVCLPSSYHGNCWKGYENTSNWRCNRTSGNKGEKVQKNKKGEEPMTPVQQYLTFLQGYALAAAVLMSGPPPPQRQVQHQRQDCRICPEA